MDINLEYYKTFYYAAKELNYTKAAEKLYVSQSSVSQSIKSLEKALKTKLFFRKGKNMELTNEGKLLFTYVNQSINLLIQGEKAIGDLISLSYGEIKIGISDTLSRYYLISYLRKFHTMYPSVKIKINNRPSSVTSKLVIDGELDFGIVNINPNTDYSKLSVIKLTKVNAVIIASKELIADVDKTYKLSEILTYPLISLEKNSTTRKIFENFFSENNYRFEPEMEFGSIDNIIEMVKLGVGIGFISATQSQKFIEDDSLVIINIEKTLPSIDVGLISNKLMPNSRSTDKFIEMLTT
ncbi:MAG: LysR substrate-binding domain-containing protein [Acidaminobacteraceae bacterium]